MFLLICNLLDPRLLELRLPLLTTEVKAKAKKAFLAEYALNWAPLKPKENEDEDEGEKSEGEKVHDTAAFKQVGMGSFSDFMLAMDAHGILSAQESMEDDSEVGEAEMYLKSQLLHYLQTFSNGGLVISLVFLTCREWCNSS